MGGTWDLFRYPGIRSDSDMHTLGYSFKPWRDPKAIADGPSIREYIRETATEYGIDRHIQYRQRVVAAEYCSDTACWTLTVESGDDGSRRQLCCNFLLMCSGYFSYKGGYCPDFPGREQFRGEVVHPQQWPERLDYNGKRVVVIGSGATAMTLVPEMAKTAQSVTMLQRSPTYVFSWPDRDAVANALRKVLPDKWAYAITRWKNTTAQQWVYRQTRTRPERVKRRLLKRVRRELGPEFDIEKHFTPRYDPWDQRLCLVPNSDLFAALRSGRADVVTDHIDTFTATGIRLASGREIDADIIVTATGLNLADPGEMAFSVDGRPVDFADTWTYRGMMYSDVPNMVTTFGYINASWTLRADLTAEWTCRLLQHMSATGHRQAVPRLGDSDADMPARPWIEGFSAGYMQRMMHRFPKQGDREPWVNTQDYKRDRRTLRECPIEDGALVFTSPEKEQFHYREAS
jgi:cation diffusion facilitator CzcD-associated flavoprotein CzcO